MTIRSDRLLLAACVALIGVCMKTAIADEWNKEMTLQISAPVEVPGRVLLPGQYVFRLADIDSNRNIVQIFSVDENGRQHFVAMIQTIPNFRLTTPDKPIVELAERQSGDPEAIKSWFYPGDNTGWEFVYPKSKELEAAAVVPPPATPAPPPAAEPPAQELPVEAAEASPVVIIEKETLVSQIELTADPVDDDQPQADRVLPETAGNSAAFLWGGMAAFGAGLLALSLSLHKFRTETE
jgi:hypothetical protein